MKTIPYNAVYRTSIPGNRYSLMRNDVELLHRKGCFTSFTALVMCYIDALASPGAKSRRGRFEKFVEKNFAELCRGLNGHFPGNSGSHTLYERYRDGLVHGLGPKEGFALCTNDELDGAYSGEVEVAGIGRFTGINVDRLAKDFLSMVQRQSKKAP